MTNKEYYVEERCTRMLLETGVPANLQGFRYLRTTIAKVIEDPELLNAVTKKLYPTIAKIYSVAPTVIERSIRHSIEVAFNRKGATGINKLFDFLGKMLHLCRQNFPCMGFITHIRISTTNLSPQR